MSPPACRQPLTVQTTLSMDSIRHSLLALSTKRWCPRSDEQPFRLTRDEELDAALRQNRVFLGVDAACLEIPLGDWRGGVVLDGVPVVQRERITQAVAKG